MPKPNNSVLAAARLNDVQRLKRAIEAGADINARDSGGSTATILCAALGRLDCLQVLVTSGADLDAHNQKNWTAAIHAASAGFTECLRILVDAKVDLSAENYYGATPASAALAVGHVDCLRLVAEAGGKLPTLDCAIKRVFHADSFLEERHATCLAFLVDFGALDAREAVGRLRQIADKHREPVAIVAAAMIEANLLKVGALTPPSGRSIHV